MDLKKKVLLLNHLKKFIDEQYSISTPTEDVLGMLNQKKTKYSEKIEESFGTRRVYLENYILYIQKRMLDFQYFRNKYDLKDHSDLQIFNLIHFRDKIIFNKIFSKEEKIY
jgi:hypothetical protein